MKKKYLLMMLVMLIGIGMAQAKVVQVGNISGLYAPINTSEPYSLSQQFYTWDEIGETGTINSISLYKTSEFGLTRNIDIYMTLTPNSMGMGDWVYVSAEEKVFSGSVTFPEGQGWVKIPLSTPYEINKNMSQNLVFTIYDNTGEAYVIYDDEGNPTNEELLFGAEVFEGYGFDFAISTASSTDINPLAMSGVLINGSNCRNAIQFDITPVAKNTVKCGSGLKTSRYLPTQYGPQYVLTQQIYTADEIGMSGTIKSFSIKTSNENFSGSGFSPKVKVYMAHTSKSKFSNNTDFIDMSTAVLVYEDDGWMPRTYNYKETFTLDTPFDYDGKSNLALIWVDEPGSTVSGLSFLTYSASKMALYASRSQGSGAFDLTNVYSGTTYYSGSVMNEKNQVWFDIIPSASIGTADNDSYNLPIYSNYGISCSEQIYTSAEIGRSGFIDAISFYCTYPTNYTGYADIDIYMAKVAKSTFTSVYDWYDFKESDKVFTSGDGYDDTFAYTGNHWCKVKLNKPFKYDGTDNIIIGVSCRGFGTPGMFSITNTSSTQAICVNAFNTGITSYDMTNLKRYQGILLNNKNNIVLSFQDEWHMGEGNEATGSLPFDVAWGYSITQQIYTIDDLVRETGDITSMAFYNKGGVATRKLDIYMTAPTSFTSYPRTDGYYASQAVPTPADMVFSGEVTFAKNEWTDIPLNKVYHWSYGGGGVHSLVLTVIDKTGSYKVPYPNFLSYPAEAQAVHDYGPYTSYTPEDMRSICQNEGRVLNYKNQIQFNNVPVNIKPTGLYATGLTFRAATMKWYGESTNGWNLQYKASTETEWTNVTLPNSNNTSYTISGLTPRTTYDVRVQMVYTDGTSDWTETQFSTDLKPTNIKASDVTYQSAVMTWEGPGSMWDLQYKKSTEESWTVVTGLTEKRYELTGLEEDTYYDVQIRVVDNNGEYGNWARSGVETPLRFPVPINLWVPSTTAYTAVLQWEETGDATKWQIRLVEFDDSYEIANETIIDAPNNPFILTGLKENTTYNICIRSVIDAENELWSKWSSEYYFYTSVANPAPDWWSWTVTDITPTTATINWDGTNDRYKVRYRKYVSAGTPTFFDDFSSGNYATNGWTVKALGDSPYANGWSFSSMYDHTTSGWSAESYSFYAGIEYGANNWLITPQVQLGGTLKYWEMEGTPGLFDETYEVLLSTTGTNPEDFTEVLRPSQPAQSNTWTEVEIDLSAYMGQKGYIAIHHFSIPQGSLLIDDFAIYGSEPWLTVETKEKSVTLEDLEPNTEYEFEVIGVMQGHPDASVGYTKTFYTMIDNPAPCDIVAKTESTSANISWTGYGDKYVFEFREMTNGFFDDFEKGNPSTGQVSMYDWTVITRSGHVDGKEGWFADCSDVNIYACSHSWYNGVGRINADNWLITPKVMLGGTLKYKVRTNKGWEDDYEVLLSTTGMDPDNDFTITLRAMAPAAENTNDWVEVSIDLSAYEGQEGYIAIHHQDENRNYLHIDDFGIYLPSTVYGPWRSLTVSEAECLLGGLMPNSTYQCRVISVKDDTYSPESDIFTFTTKPSSPIEIVLDNYGDNTTILSGNAGAYANVTIQNLMLKEDVWQAICLPFDLDESTDKSAFFSYMDVREVESVRSLYDKYIIMDCLTPVTKMKAGYPYLVKSKSGDHDNYDFLFVTIDPSSFGNDFGSVVFQHANYFTWICDADQDNFFVTSGEKGTVLTTMKKDYEQKAFESYFYIYDYYLYGIEEVLLNTGDDEYVTGLRSLKGETDSEVIYNVAGQRLGKVQKGVNIVNGKKILVK